VKGIKAQLFLASLLPIAGFALIVGVALVGLEKTNKYLETAHKSLVPNLVQIAEMRQSRNKFAFHAMVAIEKLETGHDAKESVGKLDESFSEFQTSYKKYTESSYLEGEEAIHEQSKADVLHLIELMNEITVLIKDGSPDSLAKSRKIIDTDLQKSVSKVSKFNGSLIKMYTERASLEDIQSAENKSFVRRTLISVSGFLALLIFGLLFWIARRISNSVNEIAQKLTKAGGQVTQSVGHLKQAGDSLSQSSNQTAASLQETVASLEELTSMVKMNSENAKQAAGLANTCSEAAQKGESEMTSLIQAMGQISESSKKIEEIISVIDDIAFQTNLLALNAAVEAARAGEQGKGFAVVADAVRTLAQRSSASAKDIGVLIQNSVSQIHSGGEKADSSGAVLKEIVQSIKSISTLNSEIAAGSAEQTTGIQQINQAMNQLDQSAQSNAASAEEIAASSSEINKLAGDSQQLTRALNLVVLGRDVQELKAG
jgi:methyl-accepting chemotaxis protein